MPSGDKNVSLKCIVWMKEFFFRQSYTCPFLTKDELVYKNPLKRSVLKPRFQNPKNLERLIFSHDSHKSNFQLTTGQKKFKYSFTPTARGIIRSTNEILRKN